MTLHLRGLQILSRKNRGKKNIYLCSPVMKKQKNILFFLSFFLLMNLASFSQDTSKVAPKKINHPLPPRHRPPSNPLPTLPQFPGGKDSLAAFIKNNTKYPKTAKKHHISGVIEVDFSVTIDGSIKNPTVLKSLGYGCDEEAIRVVKLMPKWIPSRKGREPMENTYHVDIPFGKQ